ncbi:MAG: hypothetical protein Q7S10_03980 [bacterium]|nr:hypothetical protein [bacterium]
MDVEEIISQVVVVIEKYGNVEGVDPENHLRVAINLLRIDRRTIEARLLLDFLAKHHADVAEDLFHDMYDDSPSNPEERQRLIDYHDKALEEIDGALEKLQKIS